MKIPFVYNPTFDTLHIGDTTCRHASGGKDRDGLFVYRLNDDNTACGVSIAHVRRDWGERKAELRERLMAILLIPIALTDLAF